MNIIDIREDFIKFFREHGHKYLMPSPVFNDDPSLIFVNAGMNQLKNEFINGEGDKPRNDKFRKLCNSQICIRAGGKHNDLDDVGMDSYHLTSFEMLGNWSMNSYKKDEAIELAFKYLTEHLKLDKNRMYVTYYDDLEHSEIKADVETKTLWGKYFPEERIIKGNFKDNFWMMAETGPCGMSTEIHYDISDEERFVPGLVNQGDPSLIEIWNIVFIQYNRCTTEYVPLDRFYVDTGMGLERLAMVLQKKSSVYLTDGFHFLFGYARAITNYQYQYTDCYDPQDDQYMIDCSYRIFCDHIRTIIIALFDGVDFDFEGRGFVLRKIFRRLMSHLYVYLNNYHVVQTMTRPIILGLITDVLNYHMKKKHDNHQIQQKLIAEEHLLIGKLQNLRHKEKELNHILELNKIDHCFDYYCNQISEFSGSDENLKEVKLFVDKLQKDGIPSLIIMNMGKIKVTML